MKKILFLMVLALLVSLPMARATDILACISDTDFGCFGGSGNGIAVYDNGGTITTSVIGTASISSDLLTGNVLSLIGTVGNFTFTSNITSYNPAPGTDLDMSFDASSSAAGTLYVVGGADNYTGAVGSATDSLVGSVTLNSGTTSATDTGCFEAGSGSFVICGTGGATIFGTATTTTSGSLNFSPTATASSSPYGLEEDLTVVYSGAGTSSGDLSLVPVPEPASLALFGTGLLGLAGFARRRFLKK